MSSGDFSNLVIRRATAYNPDGSFIKDGYVFTVGANGKQSWTPDLKLNNLVLSTFTLNSQLYVASSMFDRAAVSTLNVSTLSASSMNVSKIVIRDAVTCTLAASTLLFPSVTFDSIGASSMVSNVLVANDTTASTLRATNLSASNFTFLTLTGSTLTGNSVTVQSTLTGSTVSITNLGFTSGTGSTLTTNSLTVLSTILGSSLTVSSVTSGSVSGGAIQGNTLSVNTVSVQSTLSASTLLTTNLTAAAISASVVTYSTLVGSTLSVGSAILTSTTTASTVNAVNVSYSTLTGGTMVGSSVSAVNVGYSTLTGSTLAMNTGFWNSTLIGSTLNMINATYSTLQGSTLSANTVVWNSTLIGSTLNAIYMMYSIIQGSTIIANNVTVQTTLTASTVNSINVGYSTMAGSTLGANTVVIQSTLTVSSVSGSTLTASTIGVTGLTAGSIGFSTMTGSSMTANTLAVGSTLTASSLNTVNMSYSTLQGGAIQSQSMIASTLTGSTINFSNLTFSTLLASTMTANVMFPLSLQGSTMNVSNLLTATNVGIGTTATAYPLAVSNTAISAVELNRNGTAADNFYASGTVYTVTDPTGGYQFKGKYAYAFGGAKTLATTTQSQAVGYYAIDVAATNGLFGSDSANGPSGAMFYMDSTKTYFQNTALGVGTTSPSWPLTVAKDISFAAMNSNPLDAALVIRGQNNNGTLKIGTYYTGASFGAAIQSSQFSGSDTVGSLILNPLGGNVGIGVINPVYKLQVAGTGLFGYVAGSKKGIFIANEDSYSLIPCIQGVSSSLGINDISINPGGGRVGIGTNAPSQTLEVFGAVASSYTNLATVVMSGLNGTYGSIEAFRPGVPTTKYALALNGYGGNVGVGLTTPSASFHVLNPTAQGGNTIMVTAQIIGRPYTPSVQNGMCCGFAVGAASASGGANGRMDIMVSGVGSVGNGFGTIPDVIVATFLGSGYVGIGTVTPAEKLHVFGDGARIQVESNTTANAVIQIKTNANTSYIFTDQSGNLLMYPGGGQSILLNPSSGNVGIGTVTPGYLLTLFGSATTASANSTIWLDNTLSGGVTTTGGQIGSLQFSNNGVAAAGIFCVLDTGTVNNNGALAFYTRTDYNATYLERMRITRGGNVGIGTSAPVSALTIFNTSTGIVMLNSSSNSSTRVISGGVVSNEICGLSSMAVNGSGSDAGQLRLSAGGGTNANTKTYIDLYGYNTNEMYFGTAGTIRMSITQNVNVNNSLGVGDQFIYNNGISILYNANSNESNAWGINWGAGNSRIAMATGDLYIGTKNNMYFTTNTTTTVLGDLQMGIKTNNIIIYTGNKLGIGTVAPVGPLHVVGDAYKTTDTTWTVTSDERLKENIVLADVDRCVEIIRAVPLKHYRWKDYAFTEQQIKDRSKLGWIAQDVEKVFPKAINTHRFAYNQVYEEVIKDDGSTEKKLVYEDVIEDCRMFNADQMYAVMYGAIQKLIAVTDTLQMR